MTTVDALLLWARSNLGRLSQAWRQMTVPERLLAAALLAVLVSTPTVGLLTGSGGAWIGFAVSLVAAWLLVPVLADALLARATIGNISVALFRTNATNPTGAPRVAEVPCRHGDMHRFVYGPDGWEPAGPAPDTRTPVEANQ